MAFELNVKHYVNQEYQKLKQYCDNLSDEEKDNLEFHIYQIGNDHASNKYIANKIKKLEWLGIPYVYHKYEGLEYDGISISDSLIQNAHCNKMIQLPIPDKLKFLTNMITYGDVNGLGHLNKAYRAIGRPHYTPCTAKGIRDYMRYIDPCLAGKSVLIINRSELVGKPLSKILLEENMLVTVAHSCIDKDKLISMFGNYDYIVSGIGIPDYFSINDLHDDCTFIDASINFDNDGNICGDLELDENCKIDCLYTPVPNGVGQLTVLALMKNIVYGTEGDRI
jgi:methylenetetrahydrofolate dehydrogenase (NADP+)/methenyltetrahydrofolate cyclohydrolase